MDWSSATTTLFTNSQVPFHGFALFLPILSLGVSAHILLHKRSSRSAAAWVALVWVAPVWGALAYALLGVNRVARHATRLAVTKRYRERWQASKAIRAAHERDEPLPGIRTFLDSVSPLPVMDGNTVTLLDSGEHAYPAMIEAIDGARHSIALQSFIFDRDRVGEAVIEALGRAVQRGVEVRVLLDGIGAVFFSWPHPTRALRRAGVRVERFLWTLNPLRMTLLNLRNHRKVLIIDGQRALTGGMNIRASFVRSARHPKADRDLHCQIQGPAVREFVASFALDWAFTTGEILAGEAWYPVLAPEGESTVRVIPDGPDEDLGDAELAFVAGLSCAKHHVVIHTPYFLPEDTLITALGAAARRGVRVEVLLPAQSNQPIAAAASRVILPHVLEHGVHLWACEPPFDHSKIMVVDGAWSLLGSANWDPRSLRLNFEVQVELWGEQTAATLLQRLEARKATATPITKHALASRSVFARVLDGIAHLWTPYL